MRKWSQLRLEPKARRSWFEATRWVRNGVSHAWYWLRCHTWTSYHIIDIRGQDGYHWGWIDRDHAMYLACFKLLVDYVEHEDPRCGLVDIRAKETVDEWDREALECQYEREKEIRALYDWWTKERKLDQDAHAAKPYDHERQDRLDAKDDEMLERLMKIRKALWT